MGEQTYFMALNAYSDLTSAQFIHKFANLKTPTPRKGKVGITLECKGAIMDAPNPPETIDWGNKVTPALNQGECGKNWAIVAVGAVESLYSLKIGTLQPLSIQQLLDCSGDYGNEGCRGGFMDQAFWYMIDFGIATNKSYPQADVGICRYSLSMKFTGFTRCARIPSGNYSKLLSAIVQQPVSIALNLAQDMQDYSGGVYDGACTTEINHGMLLTGYGGVNGTEFWRLRNTFGTSWGTNGYIHIARTEEDGPGKCGIQLIASVPQVLS